ncbi:MAG TPA: chromosomal replication initiator protein DnaA, partial [Chitinophagales bacterium]|nr:chromosomal replication initiator protein DnaA [Chitinophagales bacterium]
MKTLEDVWTSCLQTIETLVNNAQSFETWFKPIKPVKLDSNVLTLLVPSKFFYDWIEEHHADKLSRAVKEVLGNNAKFEYQIPVEKDTERNGKPIVNGSADNGSLTMPNANRNGFGNPHVIPGVIPHVYESGLIPWYTFANFVEGDCNLLAKSAAIAIAKNPGTTYNPMVVHGGVGLGKTHIAHAIGNEIQKLHPDKKVVVVPANRYLDQFIDAVKSGTAHSFSNFYNSADVLIIDDIHVFSNKDKTQENLFHVFNVLHQKGKQLIFTSDVSPSNLQGMDARLLSRFKWGLTVELQAPDYETRIAILERKAQEKGFILKREFAEYIAHNIKENIRELEGTLNYIRVNVN